MGNINGEVTTIVLIRNLNSNLCVFTIYNASMFKLLLLLVNGLKYVTRVDHFLCCFFLFQIYGTKYNERMTRSAFDVGGLIYVFLLPSIVSSFRILSLAYDASHLNTNFLNAKLKRVLIHTPFIVTPFSIGNV